MHLVVCGWGSDDDVLHCVKRRWRWMGYDGLSAHML